MSRSWPSTPHAHYLGKEVQALAILPGGVRKWLIWIKDWDFNFGWWSGTESNRYVFREA